MCNQPKKHIFLCYRQHNETAKHLAEKRQIRIALREHIEDREENGVNELPLATRSLSMDSVAACEYEKEGSDFSSRSSNSEMTSSSAQTPGNFTRASQGHRSSVSYNPTGRLRKGYSTPDIHALGRMYCEANMLNRQSRNSVARGSQCSLNSIREVCSKYQIFDIPLEKRIKRESRRSVRFGSVGFIRQSNDRSSRNSTQTLPRNKTVVNAMVHAPSRNNDGQVSRSSSIRSNRSSRLSVKDFDTSRMTIYEQPSIVVESPKQTANSVQRKESIKSYTSSYYLPKVNSRAGNEVVSHYHDPDSLRLQQPPPVAKKPVLRLSRPESPSTQSEYSTRSDISNPDSIYSQVAKPKPKIMYPKPDMSRLAKPVSHQTNNIYATVNKSMIKAAARLNEGPTAVEYNSSKVSHFNQHYHVTPVSKKTESNGVYSHCKQTSADSGIDNSACMGTLDRNKNSIYDVPDDQQTKKPKPPIMAKPKITRTVDKSAGFTKSRGINIDKIHVYGTKPRDANTSTRGMDNYGFTDSYDDLYLEEDEEDAGVPEKDFIYARMATFKPVATSPITIHGLTDTLSHI